MTCSSFGLEFMSSFDDKQSHTAQESEWGGRQSCFQKEVGKKNFILVGVDTFSFIYLYVSFLENLVSATFSKQFSWSKTIWKINKISFYNNLFLSLCFFDALSIIIIKRKKKLVKGPEIYFKN